MSSASSYNVKFEEKIDGKETNGNPEQVEEGTVSAGWVETCFSGPGGSSLARGTGAAVTSKGTRQAVLASRETSTPRTRANNATWPQQF